MLLATEGFRDTLEIRRGLRHNAWDHRTPWPEVLVRRKNRLPVRERIDKAGVVVTPICSDSVRAALSRASGEQIQSVAICFLNSHMNPTHEKACEAIVHEIWPDVPVTCSSDLVPKLGEYERCSTAVVNAYLVPTVAPYLEDLQCVLTELGLPSQALIVQSNGGSASTAQIKSRPAALALSGPAAGIGALRHFAESSAGHNLICIEIGGTSCDVTLVKGGRVAELDHLEIGGRHIALPSIEIHTIGTGGGTIAGVDTGGILYVGPQGAGADPGPACYGRGGKRPTVTDAQLVLGRLRPGSYANGTISLDPGLAEAAINQYVAEPLGLSVVAAAAGIIELAEQQIRHAIERMSYERGLDARRFTIVGAGGAGAQHVASVTRSLGSSRTFVPKLAGVFCALGLCNSDVRIDSVQSLNSILDRGCETAVSAAIETLSALARERLMSDGFDPGRQKLEAFVTLRYLGQNSTLSVPVDFDNVCHEVVAEHFTAQFDALYGHHQPDGIIELTTVRLAAYGVLEPIRISTVASKANSPVSLDERAVYFGELGKYVTTDIYRGDALLAGQHLSGPAVIEETSTTVVIGPRDRVTIDDYGNYLIDTGTEGAWR